MIGGLSLIILPICLLFVPQDQDIAAVSLYMFYLAFVVNYPHFLISYQFLYSDNLKGILKDWRLFLAGVIVPVVLMSCLLLGIFFRSASLFGYMVNALFFFVGHHYVKQIIGCVVVTSGLKEVYFTKKEKMVLSVNMLAMWMISFFGGNIGKGVSQFHGIKYTTLGLPQVSVTICYVVILASLLIFTWQILQKFIKTGKWVPLNSLVAFASIYAWYIPVFSHISYFYMIPFFHSLQYLLFAFAYVNNRFHSKLSNNNNPVTYRNQLVKGIGGYIAISFILGFIFFHGIPYILDRSLIYNPLVYGSEFFMFVMVIFINIHHYFIDFAIWRRGNKNIQKYLYAK